MAEKIAEIKKLKETLAAGGHHPELAGELAERYLLFATGVLLTNVMIVVDARQRVVGNLTKSHSEPS